MTRGEIGFVFCGGPQYAAADTHAFEIGDWFGKNGKERRRHAVWTSLEALPEGDRDLVVDETVFRIPKPGVGILGRNPHIGWAWHMFKVLQSPGIGFADRHGGC